MKTDHLAAETKEATLPKAIPESKRSNGDVPIDGSSKDHPAVQSAAEVEFYKKKFIYELESLLQAPPSAPSGAQASRSTKWRLGSHRWPLIGGYRIDSTPAPPLARLTFLSRILSETKSVGCFREAYFATMLLKQRADTTEIEAVLDDLEFASSRNTPIRTVMHGVQTFALGAVAVIIVALILYVSFARFFAFPWKDIEQNLISFVRHPLVVSTGLGMIGSIVSIVLRLGDFEESAGKSQQFLRMTGLMLPAVGAFFAFVSGAMFASGMIAEKLGGADVTGGSPYVFIVIGFLSGFSERFTRGMLEKIGAAAGPSLKTST
jgi:hypothetical protein